MNKPVKLNRTLAGVREALFDEMDRLRAGTSEAKDSAVIALLAKGIIDSASLQLQFEKAWHEKKISDRLRAIELVPGIDSNEPRVLEQQG